MAYYAYQVFYLDERTDASNIDDSTSSTSIFLGASSSENDEENMSHRDKIEKILANIRIQVIDLFFNTTYNLNILVDHENKSLIETTVTNSDLGIGLDIKKGRKNTTVVTGFKEFPSYTTNPATLCHPSIKIGDCIVAIDGELVDTFAKTVSVMKACPKGELVLHLRRSKVEKKRSKKGVSKRRQL